MSNNLEASDLARADMATLEFILAEADKRIESQVQLMLASDARANGLLAASATLAAAGLAVVGDRLKDHQLDALLWSAAAFLVFEVAAAAVCIATLWPVGIKPKGWEPSKFREDVAADVPLIEIKRQVAAFANGRVRLNREAGAKATSMTRLAMVLLALGPAAGLLGGVVSASLPSHDARTGKAIRSTPSVTNRRAHGADQNTLDGHGR